MTGMAPPIESVELRDGVTLQHVELVLGCPTRLRDEPTVVELWDSTSRR